ncbi:MAG: hypothetical protein ACI8SK_000281 [Shewanella sp.]|jgi:hypothetical protein
MTGSLNQLLAPYINLSLSAFDNAKLVVAVISASLDTSEAELSTLLAYEASLKLESESKAESYYLIKWQDEWAVCGRTNSYAASISIVSLNASVEISALREVNIPVMSMQQVSFMCMENAHFDHC